MGEAKTTQKNWDLLHSTVTEKGYKGPYWGGDMAKASLSVNTGAGGRTRIGGLWGGIMQKISDAQFIHK